MQLTIDIYSYFVNYIQSTDFNCVNNSCLHVKKQWTIVNNQSAKIVHLKELKFLLSPLESLYFYFTGNDHGNRKPERGFREENLKRKKHERQFRLFKMQTKCRSLKSWKTYAWVRKYIMPVPQGTTAISEGGNTGAENRRKEAKAKVHTCFRFSNEPKNRGLISKCRKGTDERKSKKANTVIRWWSANSLQKPKGIRVKGRRKPTGTTLQQLNRKQQQCSDLLQKKTKSTDESSNAPKPGRLPWARQTARNERQKGGKAKERKHRSSAKTGS